MAETILVARFLPSSVYNVKTAEASKNSPFAFHLTNFQHSRPPRLFVPSAHPPTVKTLAKTFCNMAEREWETHPTGVRLFEFGFVSKALELFIIGHSFSRNISSDGPPDGVGLASSSCAANATEK